MDSCIFCRIVAGASPAEIVYQDGRITAFRDIHPAAPTHILIVPNRHIDSVSDLNEADEALMGGLFSAARRLAQEAGIDHSGYRLIVNTGPHGGQTVYHLHMHLLGGGRMKHPMG